MKKVLLLAALSVTLGAYAQIKMPQPSPTQTISQDFGLGKIELSYSRPDLKGRKAFDDNSVLAPVGKVWRTGANSATTINFTEDVTINGTAVKAGKYGLLTIPGKKEWTIIITKDLNVNQPSLYKQENDVVRYTAAVMKMSDRMETFTMQFGNMEYESCELHLMWDKSAVSLPITVNIKEKLRAEIDKSLEGDKPAYVGAANFYYEWMKDYNKALLYVTKALDTQKDAFWLYLLKAKIQKDMGDKVGAKASAETCITIATKASNDDYVRSAKDLISKL